MASSLAACGVVDSNRVDLYDTNPPPKKGCTSDLGYYALPKAFLHIKVARPKTGDGAPDIVGPSGHAVDVVHHADPSLVFCLDYLNSAFADDQITIKMAPAGGSPEAKTSFLGAVLVNATDRTVYIVQALLRAAFIIASGKTDFTPRGIAAPDAGVTLADLEYDPFNRRDSAENNARLSKLGICVVMEGFTFDRWTTSVDAYCDNPERYDGWPSKIAKAYNKMDVTEVDPKTPGLLYRPRVPYRVEIYRKPDPRGPGRWRLSEVQQVVLENFSPVLALDVKRAAFAGRNASFIFNEGALTTACVSKGSEVEGFVQIPLEVARSIVALPGAILTVRYDAVTNARKLAEAQGTLWQVQQAYLAALEKKAAYQAPSGVKEPSYGTYTLTPPADFTAAPTAPGYATKDLFGADVSALCKGA